MTNCSLVTSQMNDGIVHDFGNWSELAQFPLDLIRDFTKRASKPFPEPLAGDATAVTLSQQHYGH